jgi:methyl-accepting chemotaxis protein
MNVRNAARSLSGKLYLLCTALAIALAGVAAFAYVQLNDVIESANRTKSVRVPQLAMMAQVELNVTRMSLQLRHAMLARTPQERTAALEDIAAKKAAIDTLLADYERSLYTVAGRQRFEKIPPAMAGFLKTAGENLEAVKAGDMQRGFAFLVDRTIPARNALLTAIADNVTYQQERLGQDIDAIGTGIQSTLAGLLAVVVGTIVALGAFAAHVTGALRRRIGTSRAVAERVRDGDLTTPVGDSGRDEFSPLLATLGDMQGQLVRIVREVRRGAEQVATASAEIAQGNQHLSQRTEEQASSLQMSASSMEQLGETVRRNAENARQARELAGGASSVAARGGTVVGQVVETMRGIHESSRRIAEINATIDGIAFQTNILALNAAVEAARAGEQGRGFAVVAGEVRTLAQRSADAARQIKALIDDSVTRVATGTGLVDQAGGTMQEIVESVRRVDGIVAEIATASQQQTAGVAQVGDAVVQIDQATQQNAALVEQSAAAADSMRDQARQLVEAVAVFRVPA